MKLKLSLLLLIVFAVPSAGQRISTQTVPRDILLRIVRAEDTRSWNSDLESLFGNEEAAIRSRAALASGRIGDDKAVPALITLLKNDKNESVRAMVAFALGEIESPAAAGPLMSILKLDARDSPMIRSRVVEALGKIAASVPKSDDARAIPMRKAIQDALEFEAFRRSAYDDEAILLGITAALRAHPENAGKTVARFLRFSNPRIRMDAANTLARLKLNDGNPELRDHLTRDPDPLVRANAARVLGATEDKAAFEGLLERAINDQDLRVRVSAIRALAILKDVRAGSPLSRRADLLLKQANRERNGAVNELIEIATLFGRICQDSNDFDAVTVLKRIRKVTDLTAPEVELALARISPNHYLEDATMAYASVNRDGYVKGRALSAIMQALRELAAHKFANDEEARRFREQALIFIGNSSCINYEKGHGCANPTRAVPDALRAYVAFKPGNVEEVLTNQFNLTTDIGINRKPNGVYSHRNNDDTYEIPGDVIARSTAADLMAEFPPSKKTSDTLIAALPIALEDELNDAATSVLDTLAKQKSDAANNAIKLALDSKDLQVRRKAVELLKANGAGDFSARIGSVGTRNTIADYQRALGRIGKQVRATVNTSKGAFVIEFNPEEAPLTVDNFVMLARKGYFNGQAIPRVVPNFVIQTGDPRGDQNGGPGYSIRCEINQTPYDRGAVGMALSGKDTGGSQWFVTHSPQPHLDGGYTVFGRVVSGMNVVDNIVRGDTVRSIVITETSGAKTRKSR